MADVVDMAAGLQDEHLALCLQRARQPIPAGEPGECESCFEESERLVGGRCAFCRDGRRRPTNPIGKQPTPRPAPNREDSMPGPKSIQLPASAAAAIGAVERYAERHDVSLGTAAAELISRGIAPQPVAAEPIAAPAPTLAETPAGDLFAELLRRVSEVEASNALSEALAFESARADAAEAKLATLQAVLAS